MDLFRRLFSQANTKPENSAQVEAPTPPEVIEITPPVVGTTPLPAPAVEMMPPINIGDGITRTLPPETVISSSNEHLLFGQAPDVGMVRTNNQDAVFSFVSTSRSAHQ